MIRITECCEQGLGIESWRHESKPQLYHVLSVVWTHNLISCHSNTKQESGWESPEDNTLVSNTGDLWRQERCLGPNRGLEILRSWEHSGERIAGCPRMAPDSRAKDHVASLGTETCHSRQSNLLENPNPTQLSALPRPGGREQTSTLGQALPSQLLRSPYDYPPLQIRT